MLRFDYMPSDFNPLFLFLGDANDLSMLAGKLRSFAASPARLELGSAMPGSITRSRLELVPEAGEDGNYGVKPDGQGGCRWGLNAWQALQIADRIDLLTLPEKRSGSDIFELGMDGEIPVKVSRGEFEDDFLIRKF
jgi:hypothetical protein